MLCILVFFEFLIYIIEWIGYFSDVVVWLFEYKIYDKIFFLVWLFSWSVVWICLVFIIMRWYIVDKFGEKYWE